MGGWLVGLITTGLIVGTPYLLFAYHSPELHLVLDSVDSCVASLLAYLLYGRFLRSQRVQDLLLAQGLFLLALAGVGLTLSLGQLRDASDGTIQIWLPVTLRVIGAGVVLAAALAGSRLVHGSWHRWARVLPWLVLAFAFTVMWLLRYQLPAGLEQDPPSSAQRPVVEGHPLLLTAQGLTAACFCVASIVFTTQAVRRARGERDPLLPWLGGAFGLAAWARLNYVLFPSLYSDWLYTGDILRTGSYLLLLVGAAREISAYWSARAEAAVLEDRRRLACELHDGVVQELAYIRAEAHALAVDGGARDHILGASHRALDEARAAVDALGRSPDEPLGRALERAARQVAERFQAQLDVELDDSVRADHQQRHALIRITREAVSNAIRHGGAERVSLRLLCDDLGRRLVVHDEGAGFDPQAAAVSAMGYGLTSMADRARALQGSFSIESAPGRGTTVAVVW